MENFKRMWLHPLVITSAIAATGLSMFVLAELVSGGLVSAMQRDYPDCVSLKVVAEIYPQNWLMIWVSVVFMAGLSLGLVGLYHALSRTLYGTGRVKFDELGRITIKEQVKLQADLTASNVTIDKIGKVWG